MSYIAPVSTSAPTSTMSTLAFWRNRARGVLLAVMIALAASFIADHYGGPPMLFALVFGMLFYFLSQEGKSVDGIQFASTFILRLGVMLLGARITFAEVADLGVVPVVIVICGVATSLVTGLFVRRWLGLSKEFGVLTGGAVGICGASAAMALSSVLPQREDGQRETLLTVIVVTCLSMTAMIFYPIIARSLGFDAEQAGVFLGGTIHDVAQAVGAGSSVSEAARDIATVMKLVRVSMLVPVVAIVSFGFARASAKANGDSQTKTKLPSLPWFLIGFVILAAINSLGWLPKPVQSATSGAATFCLLVAIAALGTKTSLEQMMKVGWRPIALVVTETVVIGGFVLGCVLLFLR